MKTYRNPVVTVDAIIEMDGGIVLVKRAKEPHAGKWALPGGHVEFGESLEQAVAREVLEETGIVFTAFSQFRAYSDPKRDVRGHYITMVYAGGGQGMLKGGDDAAEAKVFRIDELPELAFDHAEILKDYLNSKRH